MAIWSADVQKHPTEDNPEGEGVDTIYSETFTGIGDLPEVRAGVEAGDYRPYYRAILENAFESDDRFRQGMIYRIAMS